MIIKPQLIALYTLVRRELIRMFRISSQVFLPPVITTSLYFLIFGSVIGGRIGNIHGISYPEFIAPGLIMMSVINNSYSNVSASLFSTRFQRNIEEMLISPMHDGLILLGFVLGGVLRGMVVGILVYVVSCFFVSYDIHHLPMTLFVIFLVATLFSLAGFANALIAKSFDNIMLIPTFVLTPLTYLGGVFYATSMLPPVFQTISAFNPILYMVSALRHFMLGHAEINITLSISIICFSIFIMTLITYSMLKRGTGLRE